MSLREFRESRGLRQDALAMLGGVDVSTISRIESGKSAASPETVVKLAVALGVSARRMRRLCDEHSAIEAAS